MTAVFAPDVVAGLPESTPSPELLSRLPEETPPAPWRVQASVTIWWHRAAADAVSTLPAQLQDRANAPLTLWMLVRYADTPVGPYSELLVSPVMLRGPRAISVPFIAVDSIPSLAAGRAHWALPKSLATFDWTSDRAVEVRPEDPADPPWNVSVVMSPSRLPLRFPMPGGGRSVQVAGDQLVTYSPKMRGLARLVSVEVTGSGSGALRRLLRSGRHRGFSVPRARLTVGPASIQP